MQKTKSNLNGSIMDMNIEIIRQAIKKIRLSGIEISSLTFVLIFAAIVFFFYLTRIEPLTSRLAELESQEMTLQAKLMKWSTEERKRSQQSESAETILASLDRFNDGLKDQKQGVIQIINELGALGKTHKVFVGDTVYRVAKGEGTTTTSMTQKEKLLDIFPSLGIDTTVIGDYRNLRRFLADLETSRQFMVIGALSFQGEERRGGGISGQPDMIDQRLPAESIPVSLKIEMNTYYQKLRM